MSCSCTSGLIFRNPIPSLLARPAASVSIEELLTRCSPCTCEAGQKWRELFETEQAEWMEAL